MTACAHLNSGSTFVIEIMADAEPYALNDNGSAKDPKAFREALRADPHRMAALQV